MHAGAVAGVVAGVVALVALVMLVNRLFAERVVFKRIYRT